VIIKHLAKVVLLLPFILLGCATDIKTGNRPTVVPTKIKVTFQGQPAVAATVTFTNPTSNTSGIGLTGADGTCFLTTFETSDGVTPGAQIVSIRKVEIIDKSKPGFDYGASNEIPPPPEERWIIPRKFSDPNTSGLKAEVVAGQKNEIVFDLN